MHINNTNDSNTLGYAILEYLCKISKHVSDEFLIEAQSSPLYFLTMNKAIDQTLDQHLINYVLYLSNNGKIPHVIIFVKFLALQDGTKKSMYEIVIGLLEKIQWIPLNQIVLATYGASNTTKHCTN